MPKENQFEYSFDRTLNGYTVTRVVGELADLNVVIPETHNGEPVVAIGSSSFGYPTAEGAQKLISITLPASVKRIGSRAFSHCATLEEVILPEDSSLGSIEGGAFSHCENLKTITLPYSLRAIGDFAFFRCDSLETVYLDTCLIVLGDRAFSQCGNLKEVTFAPDCDLTYVTSGAFSHCKNLRSVTLSKDIDTIQSKAFAYCDNLESVSFPKDSELEEIECEAFLGCPALKEVSFANCAKLKSVEKDAFYNSTLLGEIKFHPDSNVTLGEDAFPQKNHPKKKGGCYVATCVYGSYDCAPVWTLRRFRDLKLANTALGRGFIRFYYRISPAIVRRFGDTRLFAAALKPLLDRFVLHLNRAGYEDTPYSDQ